MRGLGLIALLLGVGLMFYLMFAPGGSADTALKVKKEATEDVQGFSGRDAEGRPVTDTITYEPAERGGKITGIKVLTVETGGAMDKRYGVKPGDVIYGDTMTPFDMLVSGPDDMKGFIQQAYAASRSLEVQRGTAKIKLPEQRTVAAPASPGVPVMPMVPVIPTTPTAPPKPAAQPEKPAEPAAVPQPEPDRGGGPMDAARRLRNKIESH